MKYEEKNHVLSWFLTEAMSHIGIEKFGEFDSSKLNVELRVNGIDIPIIEPMEHLQGQLKNIEEEGKDAGKQEAICKIQDNIERLLFL